MNEQTPHARCVIDRFRSSPDEFIIDAPYMCDVPCIDESGSRLYRTCGREIVPYIDEGGAKDMFVRTSSSRCAVAAGTVVTFETIDTRPTYYLGTGELTEE